MLDKSTPTHTHTHRHTHTHTHERYSFVVIVVVVVVVFLFNRRPRALIPDLPPQNGHKLEITMLSYDVAILYSFFMSPAKVKDRMIMP